MPYKKIICAALTLVCAACSILFLDNQDLWGSTLRLDEETVFAVYCNMSGEEPNEQDLEDFCYQRGRLLSELNRVSWQNPDHETKGLLAESAR